MNTLNELANYCREKEPIGAVLLSGEWGCGKTYLIENKLKSLLKEDAFIIRISLFGLQNLNDIHNLVRQLWVQTYADANAISKKLKEGQEFFGKLEFLPEWVRGIARTDWTSFIPIENTIKDKKVVLVFDDLERCLLSNVDVLGVVNDYCENQKFHTIIISNEEKMKQEDNNRKIQILVKEQNDSKQIEDKSFQVDIKENSSNVDLSYTEIKEKIIQRTIRYVPEYREIVHNVIENIKYQDDQYKEFVFSLEKEILEIFAPDRNDVVSIKKPARPHNIRSLKCAIKEFYRIYEMLKNRFDDLEKWFYSFVSFMLSYKADIIKENKYGSIFSDDNVRKLYPAFESKYMLDSFRNWILHGVWNESDVLWDLDFYEKRYKSITAEEKCRTYDIIEIDEDVIIEGFPIVISKAYEGKLTLDEYVIFIRNSYWSRKYAFIFPVDIDWNKVKEGINICIKELIETNVEGQQLHTVISKDNKEYFSNQEWEAYLLIDQFKDSNILVYSNNRKLYINSLKKNDLSVFNICQNKCFNVFDKEMAMETATSYQSKNNSDKNQFVLSFGSMWKNLPMSDEIMIDECIEGFEYLIELLLIQKEEYLKNNKQFAACHTDNFITKIKDILDRLKNEEE